MSTRISGDGDDNKKDSPIVPAPNDVLFGRGHRIYKHTGNQRYRYVIQALKREHDAATKSLRAIYGNQVVNYIQNLQPPGRFLKRQGKGGVGAWIEVDTKSAVERARQALRDKKKLPRLPENLAVEGESKMDFDVFCLATSDVADNRKGGKSASSIHLPPTSWSPPPKDGSTTSSTAARSTSSTTPGDSHDLLLVHTGESNQKMENSAIARKVNKAAPTKSTSSSSQARRKRRASSFLVEIGDEEQGCSVSSAVSSLSSSQQNVTGGGGVESSKEADYDFKNWLLLDVPLLTSKERKLAFHQLEEENRILRRKINVLKIEKSVLSKIRKTNSSPTGTPDEKLRKASSIPMMSLKAEAQEPTGYYYPSLADNDHQKQEEGRTILDIRRNTTNRHHEEIHQIYQTEDAADDDQQGDLFDSFDLNRQFFYSK